MSIIELCYNYGQSAFHTANARDMGISKDMAVEILMPVTHGFGKSYAAILAIIESVYGNPDVSAADLETAVRNVCIEDGGWLE